MELRSPSNLLMRSRFARLIPTVLQAPDEIGLDCAKADRKMISESFPNASLLIRILRGLYIPATPSRDKSIYPDAVTSNCPTDRAKERGNTEMRKFYCFAPAGILFLGLVFGAKPAQAAAGGLDPTFGKGGKVVTSFANSAAPFQSAIPADAALQSDGEIVVALGFTNSAIATEAFGLVRYHPNGALDTTFGTKGSVQIAFTNFINSPSSLAIQPDGKIVEVGTASSADGTVSKFAIARFNSNGTLDTTFGTGGEVTTNFVGVMQGGVFNPANAVLIQPDGKILVGGGASKCGKCVMNTALARYNTDGSLDTTFGNGGMVDVKAVGAVTSLAEDAAGDIFTVGTPQPVGLGGTAEFSPTGMLDSTITPAPVTVSSHGGPVAFQPDGDFVVGKSATGVNRHESDAQVVRFTETGTVDPKFNNPPFDYTGEGGTSKDFASALALDSNGQVVVGGSHFDGGFDLFGLARLNPNGSLDSTFGTGGVFTTSFAGQNSAAVSAVLVQLDGKIVAVGQTLVSQTGIANLALARYLGQ
jgi:uncharacterized delta-60 repeat protein